MKKKSMINEIKKMNGVEVQSNRTPLNGELSILKKRGFRGLSINDQRLCSYGKDCSYIAKNTPYN